MPSLRKSHAFLWTLPPWVLLLAGVGCGESHTHQREDMARVQLEAVCEPLRSFWRDERSLPEQQGSMRELVDQKLLDESFLMDSWEREVQYETEESGKSVRLLFRDSDAPEVSFRCALE